MGCLYREIYGNKNISEDPIEVRVFVLFQLSKSKLFFDEVYEFYLKKTNILSLDLLRLWNYFYFRINGSGGCRNCWNFCPLEIFLFWQNSEIFFWFILGTIGFLHMQYWEEATFRKHFDQLLLLGACSTCSFRHYYSCFHE